VTGYQCFIVKNTMVRINAMFVLSEFNIYLIPKKKGTVANSR
jgi:hypothetical protein